jgi:hypothetical protein
MILTMDLTVENGRGGEIRTPNRRFWRPLFYQLELHPCNGEELYSSKSKGKEETAN